MKRYVTLKFIFPVAVLGISYAAMADFNEISNPASVLDDNGFSNIDDQELSKDQIVKSAVNEIEMLSPDEIKEVAVEIGPNAEELEKARELKAKREFEDLWQSSVKNQFGEADITNDVDVQDIVEPSSEYRYASFGKRDPFVPPFGRFQVFNQDKDASKFEIAVVNSLQRPLDQLEVTGIWVQDNGEYRALIRVYDQRMRNNDATNFASASEAVIAQVGDPIGPAGKITSISKNRVETRQYSIDQDGTRKFDDVVLYLGTEKEKQELSEKRTIILGPGGEKVIKIESNIAGSGGGVKYIDGDTGRDVSSKYISNNTNNDPGIR